MSRLLFFVLLVANLALGTHLWLSVQREEPDFSRRERNREEAKIVSVIPPVIAARKAEETRQQVQSLAGAACVEFSGVPPADLTKAREGFAAMQLGNRLVERRVEEITRHWVFMPPSRDKRGAETSIQELRKKGIMDLSIRPDFSISMGVFSTEEAARRYLTFVEAKGAKGAQSGPFSKEMRDIVFLIREPDSELVQRVALLQRDYVGSALRAVTCPAAGAEAPLEADAKK